MRSGPVQKLIRAVKRQLPQPFRRVRFTGAGISDNSVAVFTRSGSVEVSLLRDEALDQAVITYLCELASA